MAVMTDVREAAQGLIEYAIHRSMIGQDDRIWAYNTVLECIGATGPALDMAWALQVEKLSLLHPDTLPDFDLEGTLAALAETAVANGAGRGHGVGPRSHRHVHHGRAHAEAFGCKRGIQWAYGRQRAPCRDRLVLRPVLRRRYVRRAAIARNIKWSTPTNWGDLEITINLSKPEKDPRDIAAAGAAKNTDEKYPACQLCIENEGVSRTLRRSRRRSSPRPPESARYPHPARRRALGLPVQPVRVL